MGLINMCASGLRRLAALFNKSAPSHTHDVESAMDDIQDTGAVVANVEVKSSNGTHLHAPDARAVEQPNNAQLLISGLLTAVAIALHNFPEGIVVFVGGILTFLDKGRPLLAFGGGVALVGPHRVLLQLRGGRQEHVLSKSSTQLH